MVTILLSLLAAFVFLLKTLMFFVASIFIGVGVIVVLAFGMTAGCVVVEFFRS